MRQAASLSTRVMWILILFPRIKYVSTITFSSGTRVQGCQAGVMTVGVSSYGGVHMRRVRFMYSNLILTKEY